MTVEALIQSTDVHACVALAVRIDELVGSATEQAKTQLKAPIACKAGCSFCCHIPVEVIPHDDKERTLWNEYTVRFPDRRKCSAYESRPAACAAHHSLDGAACEYSYENPTDLSDGIPKIEELVYVTSAMQSGVLQGVGEIGLGHEALELNTAVAAIIRDPSIISRWRAERKLLK